MPVVSKAQNRFFHWAEKHPSEAGVKPTVAHDFVSSMHGRSLKGLPERVQRKAAGGMVDDYGRPYPDNIPQQGETPDVWYDAGDQPHMGTGPKYRAGNTRSAQPLGNPEFVISHDTQPDTYRHDLDITSHWKDKAPAPNVLRRRTSEFRGGGAVSYPKKFAW